MTRSQISEDHSFVNNFWGHKDTGFQVIQTKIKHSLNTLQEILAFYQERIAIEKEYNKKLLKLNETIVLGSNETGSLKTSLDKLAMENYQMIKYNMKFSKSVSQQNYDKLNNFTLIYSKKIVKLENHMIKLTSRKKDALKNYELYKNKYKDECCQIKSLRFQCQGTWGKELERLEAKLNKLLSGNGSTKRHYQQSCALLQEIEELYVRDWSTILKDFYQLEAERIQVTKVNSFTYCNNVATLCVEHDQAVDNARSIIAQISPNDDLQQFSYNYGTGNKIYAAPEFVDFMEGSEEKPEDGKYTEAQFGTPEYLVRSQTMNRGSNNEGIVTSSPKAKPYTPATSPIKMPPSATTTPSPTKFSSRVLPPQKRQPAQLQEAQQLQHSSYNHRGHHSPIASPVHPVPATATTLEPVSLPPPSLSPYSEPKTPSPNRRDLIQTTHLPVHVPPPKAPSNYSTGGSSADVFSYEENLKADHLEKQEQKFRESNGSSNYSNPTTYTSSNYSSNYSSNSSNDRNWATPRKREIQQVKKYQDKINLNAKELPTFPEHSASTIKLDHSKIPIQKDFSIDFIAKALEDLNSGGNGDINQYRRSVRRAKAEEEIQSQQQQQQQRHHQIQKQSPQQSQKTISHKKSKSVYSYSDIRPAVDYVDDHAEVATRYGSINFTAPEPNTPGSFALNSRGSVRRRPKSMYESSTNNDLDSHSSYQQQSQNNDEFSTPSKPSKKPQRSLSKTPSKSYTNLHSFIQDTPAKPARNDSGYTPSGKPYVSKVRAMYTYKPQHHGELYFKKNWYLYVLHKQEDNWYVCELASEPGAGTIGLVPGNYVKDDNSF
ncbi:hypothetical protein CLIB1423_08S00672 [[Candida] railenensis]|uniref:Uncharacterized protein n=1 Tax=[Candida] railenensis TaxID=45579 RepID=A0A9P0QP16_9ASCO|nr:hypothetical protein CLIB1423_08S00672 [[Candida] railenensis]